MKKSIRRHLLMSAICIFTAVLLLMSFNVFSVFAESEPNYVAEVDSVKYEKYADAWSAVSDGGTITMLGDWTINKALTVKENKTVTINMNGFMINRGLKKSTSDGEVIYVSAGAVLNINGDANSKVEHAGTIQGDVWHYNENGNHVISGALITGGYSSNGGGAIHIKKNAQVNITNVTIAGNISTDGNGAGAIRLDSAKSSLTITDSEVCYNKATNDDGGAITLEGTDANAQIIGTKIHHNLTSEYGGAIEIDNGTVSILASENRVSEISYNTAKEYAGAIYVDNGNLILEAGTIIAHNTAGKDGGAIYVNSGADKVQIKGVFSGNRTEGNGGAIYINNDVSGEVGVKVSDAEFLGNIAVNSGGAIFVDSDDDIALSGKVIALGNTPNNLYIQKNSTIVSNELANGSRVGITTSWDANKNSPIKTSNYSCFVSDKQGYKMFGEEKTVYYIENPTDGEQTISYGGYTYPVNKGAFVYAPMAGGQVTAYYYYSDGYFADSAKYYNEHLSTMSSCVAVAAVGAVYDGEYNEAQSAENIVELFESAGFTNIYVHYPNPEFYGKDSEILSTIGYVIASREANINGKNVTILAIAVRGGRYGAEWVSNVILGEGTGEAYGFNDAANQVEEGINNYIKNYNLDASDSKFWITGFSRAGATSNLVAKRLTDRYGEDNVFAYCFESPKGGVADLLEDGLHYSNIHNVINGSDIVPFVGTTEMGFIRYGVDHILPSYKVGSSEYNKQKEKMLAQLALISPKAVFNDYFHEATISYVGSSIKELWSPNYTKAADWHPYFVNKIQEYSLTNNVANSIYNKDSTNWYGYRNYFATYKWYLYEEGGKLLLKSYDTAPDNFDDGIYTVLTLEDALVNVMDLYFGATGSKKDDIVNALDLEKIKANLDLTKIYHEVIGEWNGFSIEKKNKYFNEIWDSSKIEESLGGALTPEEIKDIKNSFYVVADFALDFIGDDYDYTDQDLLGTLVYNLSNITQAHYYETLCAWTRSYDSFYSSSDLVPPPMPPKASVSGGTYNSNIYVELSADDKEIEIYYTLDGLVPNLDLQNWEKYEGPIKFDVVDGKNTVVVLKTIAVQNDLISEFATYTYILNTNAEISVNQDLLRVYNFDGSAYLILAEYDGNIMKDVEYFEVSNNSYFALKDISLNFNNTVVAYLVRDLVEFAPLCDSVCLTGAADQKNSIPLDTKNVIAIKSFEAQQADNPEYINVIFTTNANKADFLIVSLFEENSQSDFENVIYFNKIERNESNTYTFTIKRSLLKEVLNGESVNNSSLILKVSVNGGSEADTRETSYNEIVYTVIYHLDGGINNSENPDVFTMSTETITLQAPEKEHYVFVGWYDNAKFEGSAISAIENGSVENVELYAKWQVKKYTVTYTDGVYDDVIFEDKNFEVDYASKTPDFGEVPTREGYTFVGWNKEVSQNVAGDVVYSAVWSKNHVHSPVLVPGVEATCAVPGYKPYYECEGCGYFEKEECLTQILDIEIWKQTYGKISVEHEFTEKIKDKEHLVIGTGTNCQNPVRYYYSCANCDAIGTDEWTSGNYGEHNIAIRRTPSGDQHYHVCLEEGCNYITEKMDCYGGVATCESKANCIICGGEYGELAAHTPCEDDGNCVTPIVCFVCGVETSKGQPAHKDDNADGKCDVCELDIPEVETETESGTESNTESVTNSDTESDTDFGTESDTDAESNTEIGAGTDVETDVVTDVETDAGTDTGSNTETDVESGANSEVNTEAEIETESKFETETETESVTETETEATTDESGAVINKEPTDDKKLPVGAIVGIAVGSVVVVGCGAFALVWFVIKKKTFEDLIVIFKKITSKILKK